jgi:hypothetical protein
MGFKSRPCTKLAVTCSTHHRDPGLPAHVGNKQRLAHARGPVQKNTCTHASSGQRILNHITEGRPGEWI